MTMEELAKTRPLSAAESVACFVKEKYRPDDGKEEREGQLLSEVGMSHRSMWKPLPGSVPAGYEPFNASSDAASTAGSASEPSPRVTLRARKPEVTGGNTTPR